MLKEIKGLEQSITKKFLAQDYTLIVPIGTASTQAVIAQSKGAVPIISLAAKIEGKSLPLQMRGKFGNVLDEIPPKKIFEFAKSVIPDLHHMSLIYSGQEKSFAEVQEIEHLAPTLKVNLQKLMIQNQADLYAMVNLVHETSQAIFILKDHPVVSGIETLHRQASKLGIPVVSSDEGSVRQGACFALGAKESQIGEIGAQLILTYLREGKLVERELEDLFVFINEEACIKQSFKTQLIIEQAKINGYEVEVFSDTNEH